MPRIPWNKSEYVLDEKDKTVWLRGSFMRAMALRNKRDTIVPGYQIKLCSHTELQEKKNA